MIITNERSKKDEDLAKFGAALQKIKTEVGRRPTQNKYRPKDISIDRKGNIIRAKRNEVEECKKRKGSTMMGRGTMSRLARQTYKPLKKKQLNELDQCWENMCDEFLRAHTPPLYSEKDLSTLIAAGHGRWKQNTE